MLATVTVTARAPRAVSTARVRTHRERQRLLAIARELRAEAAARRKALEHARYLRRKARLDGAAPAPVAAPFVPPPGFRKDAIEVGSRDAALLAVEILRERGLAYRVHRSGPRRVLITWHEPLSTWRNR